MYFICRGGLFDSEKFKKVRELIMLTNKDYYIVMDKLKRVVASGNFHHELLPKDLVGPGGHENTLNVLHSYISR